MTVIPMVGIEAGRSVGSDQALHLEVLRRRALFEAAEHLVSVTHE